MSKDNNIGIVVMPEWYEAVRDYSNDIKGEIFTALMEYRISGTEIEIKSTEAKIAFRFIKPYIDRYVQHYDDISRTRTESVRKRWQGNASATEEIQNDTKNTNVSKKYNCTHKEKEKEKDKDKYNLFFTAPTREEEKNKKNSSEKEDKDRLAQLTLDFAMTLLSEGLTDAYTEAARAIEYNEALGWRVETVKPNGDKTVKDFSRSPMTYLKGWRPGRKPTIPPADGQLLSEVIRELGGAVDWQANTGFIDGFRGVEVQGEFMFMHYASSICFNDVSDYLGINKDARNLVFSVLHKHYPEIKSLKFKTKLF